MKEEIWIKFYEGGALKEELTFVQAEEKIKDKVAELLKLGIEKGDRIVVKLPNSPLCIVTYLGIYRLGAIAVPVGQLEDQTRLDFIINDSGVKAVIDSSGIKILSFRSCNDEVKSICTIIYTSGTTGTPKGVCLSWNNWVSNAQSLIKHHNIDKTTVFASPLFLSHCNAHGLAMITTYISKCRLILFDKAPKNILEIISKEKVNILSVVPSILYDIFNSNKDWKVSKELKYIITAAAPLSPYLLKNVMEAWHVRIIQGYGLSESTNFSCTMPINLGDDIYRLVMFPWPSIGVSLNGVEIKIGNKDEEGVSDELFISAESNFSGYWNRDKIEPKLTVHTGDLGYYKIIEGKRFFYFKGRIKEIINRGGDKISHFELESELRKSGLEGEFAVISLPNEKYGEEVGLVICKLSDLSALEKIPKYRRPKQVFLLKTLFYTPNGKLQRRKISEFCSDGKAEEVIIHPLT